MFLFSEEMSRFRYSSLCRLPFNDSNVQPRALQQNRKGKSQHADFRWSNSFSCLTLSCRYTKEKDVTRILRYCNEEKIRNQKVYSLLLRLELHGFYGAAQATSCTVRECLVASVHARSVAATTPTRHYKANENDII